MYVPTACIMFQAPLTRRSGNEQSAVRLRRTRRALTLVSGPNKLACMAGDSVGLYDRNCNQSTTVPGSNRTRSRRPRKPKHLVLTGFPLIHPEGKSRHAWVLIFWCLWPCDTCEQRRASSCAESARSWITCPKHNQKRLLLLAPKME